MALGLRLPTIQALAQGGENICRLESVAIVIGVVGLRAETVVITDRLAPVVGVEQALNTGAARAVTE